MERREGRRKGGREGEGGACNSVGNVGPSAAQVVLYPPVPGRDELKGNEFNLNATRCMEN